ncbi:sugar ABC transporter substrate-binding protein [bacterium]|nr:sugar ABC transporter substrate-binding protein [bacterium]
MKIHYFLPDLDNPFWKEVEEGVKQEGAVRNHWVKSYSAMDSSANQLDQMKMVQSENPDAILVSPVEVERISNLCREIMEKGIPIVAIDQHMVGCVHASVTSGNLTGGINAAKYIGDHLGPGSDIVHVKAPQGYENAALRRKSFINECKRLNLQIVKVIEGGCDRVTSRKMIEQLMDEKIRFQAVFAENDVMALGVVDAVKHRNPDPRPLIVGYDGIPEARQNILNKQMDATVAQHPVEMGKRAVETLNKIKMGLNYDDAVSVSTKLLTYDLLK